jgi:hypothetical protein
MFKFRPGILHDLFPFLKAKVECMKLEEKHALLLVDEMGIKSGLEYDNTTGEILGMYYLL